MSELLRETPLAVNLFAGSGGLSEGLEAAGIHVALAVELHPQPALTDAFNHPHTAVLVGDIRDLSVDVLSQTLSAHAPGRQVDLVAGGPPCQGFSTAGKKKANDPRNDLFRHFVRVVEHLRPRMVLLENVPGFKKMYGGGAFIEASALFSALGYKLKDAVLTAAHYGVPQKRQRFVMVGWLPGAAAEFQWPTPTHGAVQDQGDLGVDGPRLPYVTVGAALEDLAFLQPGWEANRHQGVPRSEYQVGRVNGCELLFNHLATRHRAKAVRMFSHIPEGGTIAVVPRHIRSAKRTMARLHRDRLSNAVIALPDDLIHYRHHRIPTARECARLQSFDDDYVFFGKRTSGFVERRVDVPQYTQVGNAVPPLLARALGVALLDSLGGRVQDVRDLNERRRRHAWVRGSSGFAGYTLDPETEGAIELRTIHGERMALPISTEDVPAQISEPLREWTAEPNPRRGQWAPGVSPSRVEAGGS